MEPQFTDTRKQHTLTVVGFMTRVLVVVALFFVLELRASPTQKESSIARALMADSTSTAIDAYLQAYTYSPWDVRPLRDVVPLMLADADMERAQSALEILSQAVEPNNQMITWQAAIYEATDRPEEAIPLYETLWRSGEITPGELRRLIEDLEGLRIERWHLRWGRSGFHVAPLIWCLSSPHNPRSVII